MTKLKQVKNSKSVVKPKTSVKKLKAKKTTVRSVASKRRRIIGKKLVSINIQDLGPTRVVPMRIVRRRPFERVVALMLVISLNALGLLGVGGTLGYYSDNEASTENTFVAGSVDFSLEVSDWQNEDTVISMRKDQKAKKFLEVVPGESNPFFYYASSTNFVGDEDFCSGIKTWADIDGKMFYDGQLVDMVTLSTSTPESWRFTFINQTNLENRVCNFEIDVNGWQTRHDFPEYGDDGYTDTESFGAEIASWGFRINKVYYDVHPDRGEEGENEWVEIYNQTDRELDLTGWQICDNTSCDTLPPSPPIPAFGFAVVVATTTTVSKDVGAYWYLPDEVVKIDIGNLIGNGLSNDADMLVLKRPDGVVIDAMNWGTPDENWDNYMDSVWNPGATDVSEGSLLARKHPGYDTNTPHEWRMYKPPELSLLEPSDGSYTWYWGESYSIEWLAKNYNGASEDLGLSIFYTKDDNHDDVVSEGDTTEVIVEDTENDGMFDWMTPTDFEGQIWIHVLATGPENPMMNTLIGTDSLMTIFLEQKEMVAPNFVMTLPLEETLEENIVEEPEVDDTLESEEEILTTEDDVEEVEVTEDVVEEVVKEEPKDNEAESDVTEEEKKETPPSTEDQTMVDEPKEEELPKDEVIEEKEEVVVEEEKVEDVEEPIEQP